MLNSKGCKSFQKLNLISRPEARLGRIQVIDIIHEILKLFIQHLSSHLAQEWII